MDGYVTIGTELDTKSFNAQIDYLERKLNDLESDFQTADLAPNTLEYQLLTQEIEKTSNKLKQLRENQNKIDNPPNKFIKGLKEASKETEGVIKKVGKWALAVFGIRSAYMLVRQAMGTLSSYDDQLATNVEYIRYLLASSLKPVIEYLVNLAYKLLQYLNMIAQTWFGINLFASASTEEFMKQQKAMKGTSNSAKELKKTLAGFDEMNILQEDGSTKVGGGGGGIEVPTPKFEEVKLPKWMDWFIKNKDKLIGALTGIATAITLYKGATLLKGAGILESLPIGKIMGIATIVGGLAYTIANIIEYLNDPSWDNFGETIEGIGVTIVGIGITASSLFAGLIGGVVLLWGVVIKYWKDIKKFIGGIYDWFEERIGDIEDVFGTHIANIFRTFIQSGRNALEFFEGIIDGAKKIFDGIIDFFTGVFTGDWEKAWNGLAKIGEGALQMLVNFALGVWDNLISIINIGINIFLYNIKNIINTFISMGESIVNGFIDAYNGIKVALGGKKIGYVTFTRMKLAKGGIVNMPGSGIPLGNAIAGERGQEGVIPLTDSQQMALLGEAIGKYININATIPVYVGNRQIARELRKIDAENNFAFNR